MSKMKLEKGKEQQWINAQKRTLEITESIISSVPSFLKGRIVRLEVGTQERLDVALNSIRENQQALHQIPGGTELVQKMYSFLDKVQQEYNDPDFDWNSPAAPTQQTPRDKSLPGKGTVMSPGMPSGPRPPLQGLETGQSKPAMPLHPRPALSKPSLLDAKAAGNTQHYTQASGLSFFTRQGSGAASGPSLQQGQEKQQGQENSASSSVSLSAAPS